jgi:thiol-disulfide isomerase/thioredoxin
MRSRITKALLASVFVAFAGISASAQNATYTGLDGKRYETSSDRGRVVVLAVGASWLPLSETQAEVLGKVVRNLKGREVAFYFVATDTVGSNEETDASDSELVAFAKKNKIDVTVLRDPRGASTNRAFKVDQLPAFIIIDKQGDMNGRPVTGIQPNRDISPQLTQRIESLL